MSTAGSGDLILMGPPGSGKGTQARFFVDREGWLQLSTGDLFRFHLSNDTPTGRLAKDFMARGVYVPDEVTVRMVREKLAVVPRATRIIFDGFPRTVAQAEALTGLLAERGRALGAVVIIEVPREELLVRLGARVTCGKCQAVYSVAARPPKVAGICDRCGGPVASGTRDDESPEVVAKRLAVYEEQTRPVVAHYEARGLVRHVDGSGSPDEVAARLAVAFG